MTANSSLTDLEAALGRQYRLDREIGRGGMGVVYLAHDLTLDRPVAVKVVHPDLTTNRAVAARFLAEARTIAKLRHPNIVAVHAAGEVNGQLYYVMDYLAGETLRQRLARDGRLTPAVACRIAADIAGALDAAREAGVVHRDLKPENILLEGSQEQPRALLTDFGIARLVESSGGITGPGAVMGTPAYMSPEQAAGEELDGRSDLYSLGVVTFEMLTGAPPFTGPHRTVISKQILDPPPSLTKIRPELPSAVALTVMRALEKVPAARWASGHEFRAALLGERAVALQPERPRRRRWPWALATLVLSVAALLSLFVWTRASRPPAGVNPRHSIVVLPFDNTRRDPAIQWLRDGSVSMLSLSLAQWQDLTVVDQERVHDLLTDPAVPDGPVGLDLARRVARRAGVWTAVLGDYERVGDSLRLTARAYDVASGRRIDVVQVAGTARDDVRPLFDALAAKLLDLTGAPPGSRASLASVTTQSLEAYRAYLRGLDALNHWRLADASADLERAVQIDTGFALANYRLAVARGWMSPVDTIGMAAIRRASRGAERLPPRERQLIQSYLTFLDGNYEQGMVLYGQLIGRDSTDVEAWYGYSDAAFHGGYARGRVELLSRSLQGFRKVIGLDSTYALAYEHIGAMLTDAGSPRGWFFLAAPDSLAPMTKTSRADSSAIDAARPRASQQAVALAQAWTRLQPGTPRAQYHLYKAYLAGGRSAEARQVVAELRGMLPDSLGAFLGLLEARAQFVAGDIAGAGQTIRAALPNVAPTTFRILDFAPEPLVDVMTGANALGYQGDIAGVVALIKLGRDLRHYREEARDSADKARDDELWELARLGSLYGATGTRADRLRGVLARGTELVAAEPADHRGTGVSYLAPGAIGLLLGPAGDPTAITEIARIIDQPVPTPVAALLAARAGDTTGAKRLLADTKGRPASSPKFRWEDGYDFRPVRAEVFFELGDPAAAIEELKSFQTNELGLRGFDARWIILPRVHLLRGQALERLGRTAEAIAEYQAVIAQWAGADGELLPVVQQARHFIARINGTPEGR